MSFSDSGGRGGTSGQELAGLLFPASGKKILRTNPGQGGRRQRDMERKEPPGCAKCRQPSGISTSSSREWDIVLALVLISLCEELQSSFFSVCTRKAVKSYDSAASWQTL